MHISYFLNRSSISGFIKSLVKLPGLNARGLTSHRLPLVPWGNQYRIVDKNDYWIDTYNQCECDDYEEEDYEEIIEDYVVEYLSHQGWVQV